MIGAVQVAGTHRSPGDEPVRHSGGGEGRLASRNEVSYLGLFPKQK